MRRGALRVTVVVLRGERRVVRADREAVAAPVRAFPVATGRGDAGRCRFDAPADLRGTVFFRVVVPEDFDGAAFFLRPVAAAPEDRFCGFRGRRVPVLSSGFISGSSLVRWISVLPVPQ